MNPVHIPTTLEIENYLKEYGWGFRKLNSESNEVLIAPYRISDNQGIVISFRVEGEFVMVSTIDFILNPNENDLKKFFELNDRIKLVKIFPVENNFNELEVGFELWAEAWNKETFFSFMDMLCMAIDKIMDKQSKKELTFSSKFATFG